MISAALIAAAMQNYTSLSCTVTSRLEVNTFIQMAGLMTPPLVHQAAILSTEFRHGQLGIEAVHATNGTQVAAPNATFEEPGPNHRTQGDQQQQARGQVGRILQTPSKYFLDPNIPNWRGLQIFHA